jgi:phenylacetyl-CoA:acceptor oxidoreductase subunit 2
MSGSTASPPTRFDWQAAGKFTLGATGAGLAACAAMAELMTGNGQPAGYLLAVLLVAGGLGLGLVWRGSGNPITLLKAAFRPDGPWATREVVIVPVLLAALLVAAVLGGRLPALLVIALGGGLLYVQARILQATDGVAAWRAKQVVALMVATALAEGAGALILIDLLLDSQAVPQAVRLAILLVVVRWPAWTFYRDGLSGGTLADEARAALRRFNTVFQFLGLLVPLLVLAAAVLTPEFGALIGALGGALAVVGGWALKYSILARPVFTQGLGMPRSAAPPVAAPKVKAAG